MPLVDLWNEGLAATGRSDAFRAGIIFGKITLVILIVLAILICTTFLLRRFFRKHLVINRVHRVLIYVFTMIGVLALIIGGVMGVFLPIIPGIPFLIAAFFLMRKYHRWNWLEKKIKSWKKRLKRRKVQGKVNKSTANVKR